MADNSPRRVWLLTQGCGQQVFASLDDAKAEATKHQDIIKWLHPYAGLWQADEEGDTKIEQINYYPRRKKHGIVNQTA